MEASATSNSTYNSNSDSSVNEAWGGGDPSPVVQNSLHYATGGSNAMSPNSLACKAAGQEHSDQYRLAQPVSRRFGGHMEAPSGSTTPKWAPGPVLYLGQCYILALVAISNNVTGHKFYYGLVKGHRQWEF